MTTRSLVSAAIATAKPDEAHLPRVVDTTHGAVVVCTCGWESAPLTRTGRDTLQVWGAHVADLQHADPTVADSHVPGLFRTTAEWAYVVPCSCGWESEPTSWLTRHLMAAWGLHITTLGRNP